MRPHIDTNTQPHRLLDVLDFPNLEKSVNFMFITSGVVPYVAWFGVSLCPFSPSMCLADIKLG